MMQVLVKARLILFAAFAMIILVLSVMPKPPEMIQTLVSWDKAQHALAYAGLTVVGGWALTPVWGVGPAWRRALVFAIAYGMLLEGAQAMGGHRVAQFADALANAFGGGVAYLAWLLISRVRGGRSCR